MIRTSNLTFWTTVDEKFEIYYSFMYESDFSNTRLRIFCHEVVNGDKRRRGEMIVFVSRDRWAGLHGVTSVKADQELRRVFDDEKCDVGKFIFDVASKNLKNFVEECKKSPEFVIKPVVI